MRPVPSPLVCSRHSATEAKNVNVRDGFHSTRFGGKDLADTIFSSLVQLHARFLVEPRTMSPSGKTCNFSPTVAVSHLDSAGCYPEEN